MLFRSLAIVESAEVIGLAQLPPELRHPWPPDRPQTPGAVPTGRLNSPGLDSQDLDRQRFDRQSLESQRLVSKVLDSQAPDSQRRDSQDLARRGLDSRGLAPLLLAAQAAGAERLLLGLGGSATNDGGFGLALALGWRFLDAHGVLISAWVDLERLERIEPPSSPVSLPELLLAVDVVNPLLGPQGASAVYGPQKGLTQQQLPRAEACLRRLAACQEERHPGLADRPGSGAAGEIGRAHV